MKKKVIITYGIIAILLITTLLLSNNTSTDTILVDNYENINVEGLAFYLENDNGEYDSVSTIPSKDDGYIFKEAVCNDNSTVSFNSFSWSLSISNMEEGRVRCKLYFDIDDAIARKYILSQNTVNEGTPDFSESATTNEGIFTAEDDFGTSYYWRGDVNNNYFYFAGFYWRIVRINGDGSIRLIYQGTTANATGSNANALSSAWNSTINDNAYIGYMYGTPGSSSYEATHANENNTTIKTSLDNWYKNNLLDYEEYISKESTFCGDRQLSSGTGIGTSITTYLPSTRLSAHEPTLKCANENDLYTLEEANFGNQALTYPIALITADEVAMAGAVTSGSSGESNKDYYLYTGVTWRTMTPQSYGSYNDSNNPKVFGIDGEGILRWFQGSAGSHGVRPVINIKKDVELEGTGTSSDPYRLKGQETQLLANYPTKTTRSSFTSTVTASSTGTIYYADTSKGRTYYFAGNPTDNWVRFAGFYWRIVRINEDGSIRLIYNGTGTGTTGTSTQIQTSAFNSTRTDNMYVGYMYQSNQVHGLTTDSTIKIELDQWYEENLQSHADKISTEAGFCGDRTSTTSSSGAPNDTGGTGTTQTYYGARYRLNTNKTPTFECPDADHDLYTVSSANSGNKALDYPIGLITADEVAYAGGVYGQTNNGYYLYTNQHYWTMSPSYFDSTGRAFVFFVSSNGSFGNDRVDSTSGVRPVINLKADVTITGEGTSSNPYKVSS